MKNKKTIELALQGGGSHGAITWGVLDRFLEDDELYIEGVSGTSAGAMNAVVVAAGLMEGSKEGAREKLRTFWKAISHAASFSPLQHAFWDKWSGQWNLDNSPAYLWMDFLSRTFSPYDLNPLDLNPLRDIVEKHIDFNLVNTCKNIKVFVTATNVRTGRPHVFTQPQICIDSLMASAALPMMFKAVEIDGEAYWDGGFTGNPALFPLVDYCDARDMVLVQVNPFFRKEVPQTARDIINRMNEITFNNSLIKELRSIMLLREVIELSGVESEGYRKMRLHCIHTDEALQALSASSKVNAEWDYLQHLFAIGRNQADLWLKENRQHIGVKSSYDVSWILEDSIKNVDRSCAVQERKRKGQK